MVYFLIYEISKYNFAPGFYYGKLYFNDPYKTEAKTETTDFLFFMGSFLAIAYIYIISLLNVRICKAELDQM